jgi:selenocysteine lyase/cysteine desulfurase
MPGRDTLLASAHTFPSIGFAMKQFERMGYRLLLLPEEADPSDPTIWSEAIDESVAVVVAMHVHSNSGKIAPVEAIARFARKAGALSVIDVCQSAGIVPIDLQRWGVDAAIGSCVKWLCGGSGAAYLWVGKILIEQCEPINVGWFSHSNPFAFDIRDFEYAHDARRFWGGTPTIAPYVLATSGIETVAGIGIDTIISTNRRLIAQMTTEAGLRLDMDGRGGTLCLTAPDIDALAASLTAAGCRFDRRANVVRLSFHIYNTTQEARRIGRALKGHSAALV